jgi:TolA-binding protein
MKLWPIIPLFLMASQPMSGLPAKAVEGNDALTSGLFEIAELHFRECLADPSLTPTEKSEFSIRLCESLIRAGNASEALDLLDSSILASHPERSFWKGQALAALGRYGQSAEEFAAILDDPDAIHRPEAGFSLAGIQLLLDQPDAAMESLSRLLPSADARTRSKVLLSQIQILLDEDRIQEARKLLPAEEDLEPEQRPLGSFLTAQLLLKENRMAEAAESFRFLVLQPQGQSLTRYHAAAIGLADALHGQGNPDAAATSLLDFIQEHPDSPLLEPMFDRIIAWLPAKPSANDPTLQRLAQWVVPPVLPAIGPISNHPSSTGAEAAWPVAASENSDLSAYSLDGLATGLRRIDTPEAQAESRRWINRLRLEHPGHFLTERALYQLARSLLDAGEIDSALSLLDPLREDAKSPEIKGRSAFIEARAAYLKGDSRQAIQWFEEASKFLDQANARKARLQAAIARMRQSAPLGSTLIQQSQQPADPSIQPDLELEQALVTPSADARLAAIEEFLTRHPSHPREAEARLAAAESALAFPSPDLAYARAQLDALITTDELKGRLPPQRIDLLRLRLADQSGDFTATTTAAQSIIDTYPNQPEAAEASLILGRNLFQAGDYNPARLVLERLASADPDPARSQVAWLLAARAAALGGTPQSKEEALILFDNAIAIKGSVTSIATLEKARHLIDIYRLEEATVFLRKFLRSLSEGDPLHLPTGFLLAEALYAQGSHNPESLVDALEVYDKLLTLAKAHPLLLNRLQYLRGTTLEQLPDSKDPSKKREKEAFIAYHSVLETTAPPVEWEYFERCGFRALALLEKAERWSVAITVAKKIASFKGPRANEAATRANQLQLKHMIWEDY